MIFALGIPESHQRVATLPKAHAGVLFVFLFCEFTEGGVRFIGGTVGTLISLGFWCIANARSEWILDDEEKDPPDAATGGPETMQPAGGSTKFKGVAQ